MFETKIRNGILFDTFNKSKGNPVKFIIKTYDSQKWEGIGDIHIKPKYYNYKDTTPDYTRLKDWKCPQLFERLIMHPNGDVRCCCGNLHPEKIVGNIYRKKIVKIWNDIHKKYCEIHECGQSHILDMCVRCAYRKEIIKKI